MNDTDFLKALESASEGALLCENLITDILLLKSRAESEQTGEELLNVLEEATNATTTAIYNLRETYKLFLAEAPELEIKNRLEYTAEFCEKINGLEQRAANIEFKSGNKELRKYGAAITTRQVRGKMEGKK